MAENPGRILVMGVGNPLMRDDGIGPRVVEMLLAGYSFPENVEVVDAGTMSYMILDLIRDFDRLVIIDALTIAAGFVLRAAAGAVAVTVPISHWLLVCTTLLALFLVLSKRRHELTLLTDGAMTHRPILNEYSPYLLDQMIGVVTASTLIAYIFYTISPETQQKFQTEWLGLTIPFPLYGIFRYLYLVHRKEGGGSPTTMLMNDRPLLACVALWAIAVVIIIYHPALPF